MLQDSFPCIIDLCSHLAGARWNQIKRIAKVGGGSKDDLLLGMMSSLLSFYAQTIKFTD